MPGSRVPSTLGVVVVHKPDGPVAALPAVRALAPQVEDLLLVHNGASEHVPEVRAITFETNRGTAAAWNAALRAAQSWGFRYLYLLDQDSVPGPDAVAAARDLLDRVGGAAVVQPARRDLLGLDPFPWNTVASGSLLDVGTVLAAGGFDERLFVDEVDHELFARLLHAGHGVVALPAATIDHRTGSPRGIRFLGRPAVVSDHGAERRRLQGFSAGVLVRRYLRTEPATATRLLLRHLLTATKDVVAGERASAGALVSGLAAGVATGRPPAQAAERACPYCEGALVGRFAAVPDWRFERGAPADVYWCPACGALAAGRTPKPDEIASWYAGYYTHAGAEETSHAWSRLWPTPARRQEIDDQRWYLSPPGAGGRFLEVGTGAGERLVTFAEAGWDVVGQDLDPEVGGVARERGIVVHSCPVEDLVGREGPFDLIGLNHVLEHVVEPADVLAACKALLAPGGTICVISPNAEALGRRLFGRWWFGLEQPRHLAIPTLESLERLRHRVGLDVVFADTGAANAAVVLGGSLARPVERALPPGPLRQAAGFAAHLVGQAMGRTAVTVDRRLGEEVVWVGQRARA